MRKSSLEMGDLIIIEGCDCTGKTTMARNLCALYGYNYAHCTKETKNDFDFFRSLLEAEHVIFDRFCYGQFVYQPPSEWNLKNIAGLHQIESEILVRGAKVIYLEASVSAIMYRLSKRGNDAFVPDEPAVTRVLNAYEDIWSKSLIKPIRIRT